MASSYRSAYNINNDYTNYNNAPNLADEDIYHNITLTNTSRHEILAAYTEERPSPILPCQKDYKMAIIRFDIPSKFQPISVYNPNTKVYRITYLDPITGVLGGHTFNPIQSDFSSNEISSNPNNINYYAQIIQAMNEAFPIAFTNFIAAYPGGLAAWIGAGGCPVFPTYVSRGNIDSLVSLYQREDAIDTATQPLHLYLSSDLFTLMNSMYAQFFGYNQPNRLDNRIIFIRHPFDLNQIVDTSVIPSVTYIINQQEFPTSSIWYNTYKILMLSDTMAVRLQNVIKTNTNDVAGISRVGDLQKRGILVDFNYEFNNPNVERISYSPSAEFRWSDMTSNAPLTKIDFKLLLETTSGDTQNVFLGPGDTMNIVVLWRKK